MVLFILHVSLASFNINNWLGFSVVLDQFGTSTRVTTSVSNSLFRASIASPAAQRALLSSYNRDIVSTQSVSRAMSEDTIRRRAACDRCHSQKIRCPRNPAQEVCDRCQKAGKPCVFSPFRQKKIPGDGQGADGGSIVSPNRSSDGQGDAKGTNASVVNRKRQRVQTPSDREESISK
jgi:hypothetical protein